MFLRNAQCYDPEDCILQDLFHLRPLFHERLRSVRELCISCVAVWKQLDRTRQIRSRGVLLNVQESGRARVFENMVLKRRSGSKGK
jgi:hypothetical protein